MKKSITIILLLVLFTNCSKQKETQIIADFEKKQTPLERLITGNERFLKEESIHRNINKKSVLENQNAQHPFAVVITCSDSRVSPEILFDQGIGDLFVVRNAGNLVSNIDLGSIEYAIEHLDAKLIVVLGHSECGAIKAYVNDKNNNFNRHQNHIDDIVETVANEQEEQEAEKKVPKEKNLLGCIDANIKHTTNLIKSNAIVKEKKIKIVPMRYDVHTGKIIEL